MQKVYNISVFKDHPIEERSFQIIYAIRYATLAGLRDHLDLLHPSSSQSLSIFNKIINYSQLCVFPYLLKGAGTVCNYLFY